MKKFYMFLDDRLKFIKLISKELKPEHFLIMSKTEVLSIANSYISQLTDPKFRTLKFKQPDVSQLIAFTRPIFLSEPTVLQLHPPLNIVGDIHGQFPDLIRLFSMDELPPNSKYLFLGDYIDRGPQGLEVMCLLLSLKSKFPNHIFLLRGNHETREMTEIYGFFIECSSKINKAIYSEFIDLFDSLPLAAVIGTKIFCIHGGLTPDLHSLSQISSIKRPTTIEEAGFLADLVWSDPSTQVTEFGPNELRGKTVVWGLGPAESFLQQNGFTKLIRAHQMVEGIEYPFSPNESVITVFSAPYYAGEFKNKGAFLKVDKSLNIEAIFLPHEPSKQAGPQLPYTGPGSKDKDSDKGKGGKGKGKDKKFDKKKGGKSSKIPK